MSLRERFKLEYLESEKFKQTQNFPLKEETEKEELTLSETTEVSREPKGKKESLKDIGL